MTHSRVDGLALLGRQLQAFQPLAALDPKQVRARRLLLQPPLQTCMDFVLAAAAGAHQLLATRQPATQNPAALIGHPHRLKLTLPQQARQRPRVELVGLRPRAGDPRVIGRHDHDTIDARLQRDNDTDRYELKAQSRQVAGAAARIARARSHRSKRPTRLRSPKQSPCPGSGEPTADTGQSPMRSFMPRLGVTAWRSVAAQAIVAFGAAELGAGERTSLKRRELRHRSTSESNRRRLCAVRRKRG